MLAARRFDSKHLLRYLSNQVHVGQVEVAIKDKLEKRFKPSHLEVLNESHMHSVPRHSETHFRVIVVAQEFSSLNTLKRHRLINETLKQELSKSIHALAIQTFAPQEWNQDKKKKSPACKGGMGL